MDIFANLIIELECYRMKIRKAVIPSAGLGTRFLPATKAQPKEMLPIVDKPAIQYIVEEAVQSGIESILIVTGRNKKSIEDHFDKSVELEQMLWEKGKADLLLEIQNISNMANIHYIRQREPLGLGNAVLCAEQFIGDEPFAVLLGDDIMVSDPPALKQLINVMCCGLGRLFASTLASRGVRLIRQVINEQSYIRK